jgi:alpha-L-arabinofuranosidase
VATYLNIFVRNCDWVRIANLAQMVNAIAPVVTSPETAAVQPIWYPVLMHAQAALDVAVDAHVTGPVVSADLSAGPSRWPHRVTDLGPFSVIDAAATVSGHIVSANSAGSANSASGAGSDVTRRIAVTMVNRSPDETAQTEVLLRDYAFDGPAVIRTVTAGTGEQSRVLPDVATANLEEGSVTTADDRAVIELPPQSFSVLEAVLSR